MFTYTLSVLNIVWHYYNIICSRVRLFSACREAVFRDTTRGKLVVVRHTSIRGQSVATGQTEERFSATITVVHTFTAVKGKTISVFTFIFDIIEG